VKLSQELLSIIEAPTVELTPRQKHDLERDFWDWADKKPGDADHDEINDFLQNHLDREKFNLNGATLFLMGDLPVREDEDVRDPNAAEQLLIKQQLARAGGKKLKAAGVDKKTGKINISYADSSGANTKDDTIPGTAGITEGTEAGWYVMDPHGKKPVAGPFEDYEKAKEMTARSTVKLIVKFGCLDDKKEFKKMSPAEVFTEAKVEQITNGKQLKQKIAELLGVGNIAEIKAIRHGSPEHEKLVDAIDGKRPKKARTYDQMSGGKCTAHQYLQLFMIKGVPYVAGTQVDSGDETWFYTVKSMSVPVKEAQDDEEVVDQDTPAAEPTEDESARAAADMADGPEVAANADGEMENAGPKTADQLEVGDLVKITGDVQFHGEPGSIERFGQDKKFVVVKLDNGGSHSFHSSDVTAAENANGGNEDETPTDTAEADKFYVAFYDSDEERSWIGLVTKEGGGKWHEKAYKGKPEYRWGQTYMSYLTPNDIMQWIHKDYGRGVEIEGPFMDAQEAEEHVTHNWGTLEEAALLGHKIDKAAITRLERDIAKLEDSADMMSKKDLAKMRSRLKALKAGKVEEDVKDEYTPVLKAHGFTQKHTTGGKFYKKAGCGTISIDKHGHWQHSDVGDTDATKDFEGTTADSLDRHLKSLKLSEATLDEVAIKHPFRVPKPGVKLKKYAAPQGNKVSGTTPVTEGPAESMKLIKSIQADAKKKEVLSPEKNKPAKPEKAEVMPLTDKESPHEYGDSVAPGLPVREEAESTWDKLNKFVKNHFGEMSFEHLDAYTATSLIDMPVADDLAKRFGKKRFWTLSKTEMKKVVDENPHLLIGLAKKAVAVTESVFTDFDDWKNAVLLSHPTYAKTMKFVERFDGSKITTIAEVDGRNFGVWDGDSENGKVLAEAVMTKKPKTPWDILNHLADDEHGEGSFTELNMADAAKMVYMTMADEIAKRQRQKSFWTLDESQMKALVNKNPQVLKGSAARMFKKEQAK
jgi:hypothetical protein